MKVYLGLGSNQKPEFHIHQALDALYQQFGVLRISPVYESAAVGFSGDNFLNLVVEITAELSVGELLQTLRNIENQNGRNRAAPRFSGRTLDIDILLYGNAVGVVDGVKLPREEILENAFVLRPLADLAPDLVHPQIKLTMAELWQKYDKSRQRLWPVTFDWTPPVDE